MKISFHVFKMASKKEDEENKKKKEEKNDKLSPFSIVFLIIALIFAVCMFIWGISMWREGSMDLDEGEKPLYPEGFEGYT